ncbi:hypothetical protein PsYK624_117030 [Phanerochaete sordida]|uniref:Uncharacterized protein n=1 Tax=Phanerochaete sordida TaxID=48140 RepID=A0A9P3LHY4_9APHY|nr:hypothetical protein PsYK624_117030 [Phanerochaete sordida]
MKNTLLALFALAASTSVAAVEFVLNTPNEPVECVPTLLNWSGGRPPYTLHPRARRERHAHRGVPGPHRPRIQLVHGRPGWHERRVHAHRCRR